MRILPVPVKSGFSLPRLHIFIRDSLISGLLTAVRNLSLSLLIWSCSLTTHHANEGFVLKTVLRPCPNCLRQL